MQPRWEVKCRWLKREEIERAGIELGDNGWELFRAEPLPDGQWFCIFKRMKP